MKDVLFAILKTLGFLLILPLIIAFVMAFQSQVLSLSAKKEAWMLWGAGSYIALNLFVYDFKSVYDFGKTWVEKIFSFFKPAGYVLPVYAVILTTVYVIIFLLGKAASVQPYLLFAIAFSMAMHLVLTARDIYESDGSILKAHYFVTFGAIVLVNILIMSLLFTWAFSEYSFVDFIKSLAFHTSHLYKLIYKGLFIDSSF